MLPPDEQIVKLLFVLGGHTGRSTVGCHVFEAQTKVQRITQAEITRPSDTEWAEGCGGHSTHVPLSLVRTLNLDSALRSRNVI